MAYASLRLPDRIGTELRPMPMIAGMVCAIVVPSILAACVVALISTITISGIGRAARDTMGEFLAGSILFAGFGVMSVLFPFLPLILWRLPQARNPRTTCMLLGALSGPGPLGYWALPHFPGLALLTMPMGAIGGLIFWFVAVRPARRSLAT